jgi:excisionase family DNA binding protein
MEADLLRARDIAARLDISLPTVWKWTASGQLPAPFRVGRVTRWRKRDIERYLQSRCRRHPRCS